MSTSHAPRQLSALPSRYAAGFTLIEVVLVLAIGGLIFLMAFLAFGQVQQNRRDAQRRQDARRILAEAESYAANNNGVYPCDTTTSNGYCHVGLLTDTAEDSTSWVKFKPHIEPNSFKNPSRGSGYFYVAYGATYSIADRSQYFLESTTFYYAPGNVIVMARGGYCNNSVMGMSINSNTFAVWVKLEGGSGYCVSNT